jgi:hypothetical protein
MNASAEVQLLLEGPYQWLDGIASDYLFAAASLEGAGLYLWTYPTIHGEMAYYVGETGRSFAGRMREHLSSYVSGRYTFYDPAAFSRAQKLIVWEGMWRPGQETRVADFLGRHEEIIPALAEFLRRLRFYLGPTDCDTRTRKRIEAALADSFSAQPPPVGTFQDEGIRYERRRDHEGQLRVRVSGASTVVGLRASLAA